MMRRWWVHALATVGIALGLPLAGVWLLPTPNQLGGGPWLWIAAFSLVCLIAIAALKWLHVVVPPPPPPGWLRWLDDND